ncbi:MAG TPA: autotransporter-associated beta strand repeat-containing protein, partial [Sunxiuqinia sp.]|nr:autotransporter-associated beta strand repeat-containing protein [Sunxiuqinia sp.]
VVSRGIYEKIALEAFNFKNGKLTKEWHFDSDQPGNFPYAKQGYHNLTQGDVDDDGRDEIMYGSMCVDDNGKGLYSTELGHGDALHLADINPDRKGLEFFACLENKTGGDYRDARTGEIFFYKSVGRDMGRAGCADITPDYPGMEMWGPTDFPFLSSTGKEITNLAPPSSMNFFIWWDGDPLREMLDHEWHGNYGVGTITKYNNGQNKQLLLATGTRSNNWTKGTPCVSADILGDWREEVIWHTADNSALRLYTTTDTTNLKIYTLMQDPQYRAAIGWQPNSYNQPPHPSFFIGHGMDSIPPAPILMNGQKVYTSGNWDLNSSMAWDDRGNTTKFQNGDSVLFDISGNYSDTIKLSGDLHPADLRVISPNNYAFAGTGEINGEADLTKAGKGKLTIDNDCNYKGITRVWDGELLMNGTVSNSPVFVKRFATFGGNGHFNKGLTLEKYSNLIVSDSIGVADTLFINQKLAVSPNTTISMDLSDDATGATKTNDLIMIDGDLDVTGTTTINIKSLDGKLATGTYTLAKVSGTFIGDLDNISVSGLAGTAHSLEYNAGELQLVIPETRAASTVIWQGSVDNDWDIFNKKNWLKGGVADYFIGKDSVIFNDQAIETNVHLVGPYYIGGFLFDASKNMTIYGEGGMTGNASLTKQGSGKLTIANSNSYTGKTTIKDGILSIPEINNGGSPSGIGAASADAGNLVIDGGALEIRNPGNMLTDRAVTIGSNDGAINVMSNSGLVTLNSPVTGTGRLIKEGNGNLIVHSNNMKGTILKRGTLTLADEDANYTGPGNEVVFQGGTLNMYNNMNSYTDNCAWNMVVEEGQTGTLNMDSRCSLSGKLTGAGTLNVFSPWIRNELRGDWSQFEGTIQVRTDADGGWFIVSNSKGFGKAQVELEDQVQMIYGKSENSEIPVGAISGPSGAILGAGGQTSNRITWKVGGANTNTTFAGTINNNQYKNSGAIASIIKTGTGRWTLTGSNTYSGNTTVEQGTLILNNQNGSATGSGNVRCKNGAFIGGTGAVSGAVIVEDGGAFIPGYIQLASFKIGGNLALSNQSTMMVDVDASTKAADLTDVKGVINLNGTLIVSNKSSATYTQGATFQLFKAAAINGSFSQIYPTTPG